MLLVKPECDGEHAGDRGEVEGALVAADARPDPVHQPEARARHDGGGGDREQRSERPLAFRAEKQTPYSVAAAAQASAGSGERTFGGVVMRPHPLARFLRDQAGRPPGHDGDDDGEREDVLQALANGSATAPMVCRPANRKPPRMAP